MTLPLMLLGRSSASLFTSGGWGSRFSGCCKKMLGPKQGGLWGALAGGLVGTILGGGNPIMGLLGMTLGGLLGHSMGSQNQGNCCNHHHPHHQHCASYPPAHGHHFGGPQMGGYHQPYNQGYCPPQPHWGHGNNVNMNFNFGHQCPPSQVSCCNRCPRGGQLEQEKKGKPITYTTSGGYQVTVNKHDIIMKDPSGKNVLKHWGDPHENLNGKHLKDWEGKQRTVVLGDGTKITMTAEGPHGVTLNTSIYDGNQNVQINNTDNEIYHHSLNPHDTMFRELSQHDGESALFRTDSNGAGIYNNIYNEDKNFNVTQAYRQIGQTGGVHNPGKVYDFYDDPRIAHT